MKRYEIDMIFYDSNITVTQILLTFDPERTERPDNAHLFV